MGSVMTAPSNIRTVSVADTDELTGTRLDIFLSKRLNISRSRIKALLTDGGVQCQHDLKLKASYNVVPGDVFTVTIMDEPEPEFAPENIPLNIVYRDNHLMVINKPAGMVVHPGRGNISGTLANALLYHVKNIAGVGENLRPGIVHRLDSQTSGLLVVALNTETHAMLSKMVHGHELERTYTTFVWGHPDPPAGSIDTPLGRHPSKGTLRAVVPDGKAAVTHYQVTAHFDFLSKLSVRLETGRTHQIRVHLAHIGHHVFGDPVYGGREERLKGFSPEIRQTARRLLAMIDRQALHAARLAFRHPVTGEKLSFEAAPPEDMLTVERILNKG